VNYYEISQDNLKNLEYIKTLKRLVVVCLFSAPSLFPGPTI